MEGNAIHCCDGCGYSTPWKWNLARHTKRHSSEPLLDNNSTVDETICKYCNKQFMNKYIAQRHTEQRCNSRPSISNVSEITPDAIEPQHERRIGLLNPEVSSRAYIYLLQDGKDIGTQIRKFGLTVQKGGDSRSLNRLKKYNKGTIVYNIWNVHEESVLNIENEIKTRFKQKYRLARGSEWFEGDMHLMKKDIDDIIEGFTSSVHLQSDPDALHENQCQKCTRILSNKSNLVKHSKVCKGVLNSLECHNCHIVFANRQAKYRHMIVCNVAVDDNQCSRCQRVFANKRNLTEHSKVYKGVLNALECHNCHRVFNTRQAKSKHIKTCQSVASEQQSNIINNFGQENLNHITTEVLDGALKDPNGQGIVNLIVDTHFNTLRPNNHNIRIANRKRRTMKIMETGEWQIKIKEEVIDLLINRYKDVLEQRLLDEEFRSTLTQEDYDTIVDNMPRIDKKHCPQMYYLVVRKILAAIDNLEFHCNSEAT